MPAFPPPFFLALKALIKHYLDIGRIIYYALGSIATTHLHRMRKVTLSIKKYYPKVVDHFAYF